MSRSLKNLLKNHNLGKELQDEDVVIDQEKEVIHMKNKRKKEKNSVALKKDIELLDLKKRNQV